MERINSVQRDVDVLKQDNQKRQAYKLQKELIMKVTWQRGDTGGSSMDLPSMSPPVFQKFNYPPT